MSTIRTGLPATLPQMGAQTLAQPAVRAASADFFRAALAQVQGGAIKPEVTQTRTETPRDAGDGRSLRPGSLLDIRV
ncbi:MAG: hypothetical protein JWR59_570 [Brevundimonas sp.]|nr:hypothetical protein [Brevundimonas sp.]